MASIPTKRAERTQLQQIIAGLTEGIVILDPDGTITWANDAALAMHGVARGDALGSTVSEYRQRFELRYRNRHVLGPGETPMERLVAGESFSGVVVEVAPRAGAQPDGPEEQQAAEEKPRMHEVRGLILADPQGRPDCLVLVIEDQTERFSAEERFERMFGANPAPAIIVRLADMRHVKVNQGFLQMTGYLREALIGRSMHEVDVLEGAEKRDLAVQNLHAGNMIPQMEACLRMSDGKTRTVIVAGQPMEVGDENCMLFTFADLHPRKLAEDALRQSEARFAASFRMAPGPMAIIALDGLRLLDVNDAFTAATGWRREEVIGRAEPEVGIWGDGDARERLAEQVRQTGHARSVDVRLRTKSGPAGNYLLSAETVSIHDEPCVLTVMLDITGRKQSEADLLAAIDCVMQDTSWLGQKIVEKLADLRTDTVAAPSGKDANDLTPRTRQVLDLVAQGLSDRQIACELEVSQNTVRNHVSAIFRQLGVHRRGALIVWARERGIGNVRKSKRNNGKTRARLPI